VGTASRQEQKYPFVSPAKGVKLHTSTKTACHCVLMFFTEIFHLLVEQTNVYYQQHLNRRARPSRQLPDIMLLNMMTFVALALQMGHELNNKLHDYWPKLRQLHNLF